jgi:AraC-like DNA-binding protein
MALEIERQLPRGAAVSRRLGPPPWRASAGDGPTLHLILRGSWHLCHDDRPALDLDSGDLVILGAEGGDRSLRCVPEPSDPGPAELISATYTGQPGGHPQTAGQPGGHPQTPGGTAIASVVRLGAAEVHGDRALSALVGLLRAALAGPAASPEHELLARSLLDPLLVYALHAHERARGGAQARGHDGRIARALDRMRDDPARRWTVAALAKAAGLSRAAFARRFLSEIGVPPLRYLADLRMRRAAELLAEGDDPLAAVAAAVGYDSEFAFSRAFKRHTGEAPGMFRRRSRAPGGPAGMPPIRAAA